ncbi:electron transport complex subunit RsxC [Clostridiaceae bacterium UIB06]|uniref:Ion-translocating oxidoreductase complex subunit C n=1 Tax=Clostridium thailandense TaxID=2794346 RepID=A0A949U1Q0_9CLOT|nr:electron transport complex subunit RsxC [Clostridium thailandense]MBV7274694.1 electron transport complex subunit RsxC [Clostridium thailandense]MCH5137395.1 electron transport complex subunit RsxC [Clostridiaceae bacterium UIB06]
MTILTFKRGIHPPHGKYLTENKVIEELFPKGLLIYPMAQHIGAPCTPLVKKGERVLVGQKIGEANGFVSSPVHSSVSGTVEKVIEMPTSSGNKTMSVIVKDDKLYEEIEMPRPKDYHELSKEEIINLIKEAGVVGMGGAAFPTHVKLMPPPDKNIDSIVINAAECEPYLTCDHRLMIEETSEIVEGLKVLSFLFPQAKVYVGIEDNKMNAVRIMKKTLKDIPKMEVSLLKTKYPQGAEKQLIYAVTKREVPSGKLPADVGCIVQNITTVREIYNAVVLGIPVMTRVVTVTGEAVKNPKNLKVKLGTSWSELIEACDGFKEEPIKIIGGGPMMGMTVSSLEVPTVKGTSGILCLTKAQAVMPEESSCIRCSRCVQVCPMKLTPSFLDSYSRRKEDEAFEKLHGMDCIECGCCTFSCPAKRHLVQSIRTAKRRIIANRKK